MPAILVSGAGFSPLIRFRYAVVRKILMAVVFIDSARVTHLVEDVDRIDALLARID